MPLTVVKFERVSDRMFGHAANLATLAKEHDLDGMYDDCWAITVWLAEAVTTWSKLRRTEAVTEPQRLSRFIVPF
jgi:hypothetical protein